MLLKNCKQDPKIDFLTDMTNTASTVERKQFSLVVKLLGRTKILYLVSEPLVYQKGFRRVPLVYQKGFRRVPLVYRKGLGGCLWYTRKGVGACSHKKVVHIT